MTRPKAVEEQINEERFTLVDIDTGLVYGPYESFRAAEAYAETLTNWEIFEGDKLIAWSTVDGRTKPQQ
jgi:hypothetical protein